MSKEGLTLIFAGTPDFAATALDYVLASPHKIIAVYTQPDRPKGRGLQMTESPVKVLAKKHQLPVYQPLSLKTPAEQQQIRDFAADLMIVVAYGLLLPKAVLTAPRLGCINIHASLLPRWRGAAPIQRAILAGDAKTGISIMQMDEGLDTGPVLLQAECPILPQDNSELLHQRMAALGAETLMRVLTEGRLGTLKAVPQNAAQATYAAKISKTEGRIHWQAEALAIDRAVRAFYPWPIAYTIYQGETLRIHAAQPLLEKTAAPPGSIVRLSSAGMDVATADGLIRLLRVQVPGSRVLSIVDFLNARQHDFKVGTVLGT